MWFPQATQQLNTNERSNCDSLSSKSDLVVICKKIAFFFYPCHIMVTQCLLVQLTHSQRNLRYTMWAIQIPEQTCSNYNQHAKLGWSGTKAMQYQMGGYFNLNLNILWSYSSNILNTPCKFNKFCFESNLVTYYQFSNFKTTVLIRKHS